MSSNLNHDEVVLKNIEVEGIDNIKDQMRTIYNIWVEFGIDTDQKSHRAKVVWNHVLNLLKDIYDEENSFYEEIKERIKNYTLKIKELSSILAVPQSEPQGSLIKMEQILRQELDNLIRIKHKRIKTYQDLKILELKYCKILNLQEHQLSSDSGVPSDEDLFELEQHVKMLKVEKDRREKKFCLIKKELTTILETTELTPESLLEREILSGKETSLTDETFKAMEEVIVKAQKRKTELEAKKRDLVDKLTVLWQRLKIEESKRVDFLSKHSDCRLKTISYIEQEVQRCEDMKKKNIGRIVSDLRSELVQLWDKCHVSQIERKLFYYFTVPDMSDEVLEAHEKEINKWKKHYTKIEHILAKIEKRQHLWELMIAFENKASDPNRFKNRKGNLLQEERERKKLQKDLPALEESIYNDIDVYTAQNSSPFLYNGEDFKAFVTNQKAKRIQQKENEKIERQNMHSIHLRNEVIFGTPAKRPLKTTPKTAPSKLFKSSNGTSIFRTPASSNSRVVPSSVGKGTMKNTNLFPSRMNAIQKKDQDILKERNKQATSRAKTTPLNRTTYTDFASELSSPARYNFRSSVLATKKPGGTRTPQTEKSRSKRKSVAMSLRNSLKNATKTSTNLTPARGKLGLPFLI